MKITMKEKAIVSSFTLITSLTGYFYARSAEKDVVPYMMVSGFIGAFLGEAIAHTFCKDNDNNNNPKKPKTK
jgi:uncharacterized membrane protein YfcA